MIEPLMPDGQHLTTEELEEHHFGRIAEPDLTRVEEHLLWCQHCIERAEAIDRFVARIQNGIIRGSFEVDMLAEEFKTMKSRR